MGEARAALMAAQHRSLADKNGRSGLDMNLSVISTNFKPHMLRAVGLVGSAPLGDASVHDASQRSGVSGGGGGAGGPKLTKNGTSKLPSFARKALQGTLEDEDDSLGCAAWEALDVGLAHKFVESTVVDVRVINIGELTLVKALPSSVTLRSAPGTNFMFPSLTQFGQAWAP